MVGACRAVGEAALLVDVGSDDDGARWSSVQALDRALAAASIDGLQEVVPALEDLLVVFDPLVTDHAQVEAAVRSLDVSPAPPGDGVEHLLDVAYDLSADGDLASVAASAELAPDEVAELHHEASYRVVMCGFAPGYAYLEGVPERLRVPRKKAARRAVPAGSVIIQGSQCLVTTVTMPTGWWVIGTCSTEILRDDDEQPFLLDVGDRVRFRRGPDGT